MKIISQPDITSWIFDFVCYNCSSQLEADYTDLKHRIEKKHYSSFDGDGPGSYQNVDLFYVVCPVCSKETHLMPNMKGVNIPFLLQEQVKKDSRK